MTREVCEHNVKTDRPCPDCAAAQGEAVSTTPQSLITMFDGHALSCGKDPILLPAMHREALELCAAGLEAALARMELNSSVGTDRSSVGPESKYAVCQQAEVAFESLVNRNQNNKARKE